MSKIPFFLCAAVLLTMHAHAQTSGPDMAVATVRLERTQPISNALFESLVSEFQVRLGRPLEVSERKEILDKMIDNALMVQAAEANKLVQVTEAEVKETAMTLVSQQLQAMGNLPPGAILTNPEQYRTVVTQMNLSVDEFEKDVHEKLLRERYITHVKSLEFQSLKPPTEQEIQSEYQRRIKEFAISDSVWFSHIVFLTEGLDPGEIRQKATKAEKVLRDLRGGSVTFEEMVRRESEDEASRVRNGLVGQVMLGNQEMEQFFGKDFIKKLFELEINKISGVFQSLKGYHIVKITEKRDAGLLPLSDPEVHNYLKQVLEFGERAKVFEKAEREVVADLRSKATIRYFGEFR